MYKVLITDDEIKVCRLIQNIIDWEKLGLEVVGTANDGIEALDMIQEEKPDIVITDIRMPGYDGLQLIEKAKEAVNDISFVIISGHREFSYAQQAIRFGVEDYLLKPLEETELEAILKRMVKKKNEALEDQTKEETLRKRIEVDTKRMQKVFMNRLTDPQEPDLPGTAGAANEEFHCSFQEGLFQVLIVKADIADKTASRDAYELLQSKAGHIAETILKPDSLELLSIKKEEGFYFFLNMDHSYEQDLRKKLKKIRFEIGALRDLFWDIKATIAMGRVKDSFSDIRASAAEAKQVILNRIFLGLGHTVGIGEQNRKEIPVKDVIDYSTRAVILERIEVLDIKELQKQLKQLYYVIEDDESMDGMLLLEVCADLIEILKFGLKNLKYEQLGDALAKRFQGQYHRCTSAAEVFDELERTFTEGIEKVAGEKEQTALRPVRVAKKYVQDHYHEPLKLDDISQMLGFNANYFSGLFKKEVGQTFSEYLIQVRINQAKQSLIAADLSIMEVAEQVGYSDMKHFSKLFKKITGINPTEFRKLYRRLD